MLSTGPGIARTRSLGGGGLRAMWQWIHSIESDAEYGKAAEFRAGLAEKCPNVDSSSSSSLSATRQVYETHSC